jgi:hypothetical protein
LVCFVSISLFLLKFLPYCLIVHPDYSQLLDRFIGGDALNTPTPVYMSRDAQSWATVSTIPFSFITARRINFTPLPSLTGSSVLTGSFVANAATTLTSNLTIIGDFRVNSQLTIAPNVTLTVNGTLAVDSNITVVYDGSTTAALVANSIVFQDSVTIQVSVAVAPAPGVTVLVIPIAQFGNVSSVLPSLSTVIAFPNPCGVTLGSANVMVDTNSGTLSAIVAVNNPSACSSNGLSAGAIAGIGEMLLLLYCW